MFKKLLQLLFFIYFLPGISLASFQTSETLEMNPLKHLSGKDMSSSIWSSETSSTLKPPRCTQGGYDNAESSDGSQVSETPKASFSLGSSSREMEKGKRVPHRLEPLQEHVSPPQPHKKRKTPRASHDSKKQEPSKSPRTPHSRKRPHYQLPKVKLSDFSKRTPSTKAKRKHSPKKYIPPHRRKKSPHLSANHNTSTHHRTFSSEYREIEGAGEVNSKTQRISGASLNSPPQKGFFGKTGRATADLDWKKSKERANAAKG